MILLYLRDFVRHVPRQILVRSNSMVYHSFQFDTHFSDDEKTSVLHVDLDLGIGAKILSLGCDLSLEVLVLSPFVLEHRASKVVRNAN